MRRHNTIWLIRYPAKMILRLSGWKIIGDPTRLKQCVAVGVPHTGNLDGLMMFLVISAADVRARWMGKEELFKFPIGIISRLAGGVKVQRNVRTNAVQQMAEYFKQYEQFFCVMAPEGTRKKDEHWKTGFYHIAKEAGVPILFAVINYEEKWVDTTHDFMPTGDIVADFGAFREIVKHGRGVNPDQATPPILPPHVLEQIEAEKRA